jgi:integrase
MTTAKKRGRKPSHYRTADDTQIKGLSRRPSDGRWRIIATGETFVEPDEDKAIERFRRMTGQKRTPTSAEKYAAGVHVEAARYAGTVLGRILAKIAASELEQIGLLSGKGEDAEVIFWREVGGEIRTTPRRIAELTGVEEIGYFQKLKPPKPLPTFKQLEDNWTTHGRCSELQRKKVLRAWQDFKDVSKAKDLTDITAEVAVAYQDAVVARGTSGKQQYHLFTGIRRLLSFNRQRAVAVDEITVALGHLAVLVPSDATTNIDPQPVEVEDWAKLYAKAKDDPRNLAMVLLMLNTASYIGEVIEYEWGDIKASGCLVTNRNKTGKVIRVASLWDETRAALEALPRKGERLFYSVQGAPLGKTGAQRAFAKLADDAKVPHVVPSQLRDGAATAAAESGVSEPLIKVLLGHRGSGMGDRYIARNPNMVKPATDAVAAKYMEGAKRKTPK